MNTLTQLLEYQKEISNLEYTINLLKWELKINAPKSSQPDLIKLITQYESKLFELLTSEKYGTLLSGVINDTNFNSIDIFKIYGNAIKRIKKFLLTFILNIVNLKNALILLGEKQKNKIIMNYLSHI